MSSYLKKEQIYHVLDKGVSTFDIEALYKLVKLGADPLWKDRKGVSCIEHAFNKKHCITNFV